MYTEFHLDPPLNGAYNMATDEAIFHRFNQSDHLKSSMRKDFCVVRVYEWASPTISIGFSQSNKADQDIFNRCLQAENLERVTRITGGRAVLHHREITYSVVGATDGFFGTTLRQTYDSISSILTAFLKELGVEPDQETHPRKSKEKISRSSLVCYDSLGFKEISLEGKKLIGSAQKRGRHAFLQHGSIPYFRHDLRVEDYLKKEFLSPNSDRDKYVFLSDCIDLPIEDAKMVLLQSFKKKLDTMVEGLTVSVSENSEPCQYSLGKIS